jgi:hypothetical protein
LRKKRYYRLLVSTWVVAKVLPLTLILYPRYASSLERTEAILLKQVLDKIPPRFRQPIANVPARPFLKIYQIHLLAIYHMKRQELLVASRQELQAINSLETLLPNHKNHILSVDMYGILSISLFGLGRFHGIYYHMASC